MKPMMFNADMVRAIWEGQKTVTRRLVKGYALKHLEVDVDGSVIGIYQQDEGTVFPASSFAPYQPGEIVYVPEAWRLLDMWETLVRRRDCAKLEFQDGEVVRFHFYDRERAEKWRKYLDKPKEHWQSPYFMPREAARLFLRIKDVRAARLQDIDEEQAKAEGARSTFGFVTDPENEYAPPPHTAREDFQRVWDSTVKPKDRDRFGWSANPWVWVIEFERISKREAHGGEA